MDEALESKFRSKPNSAGQQDDRKGAQMGKILIVLGYLIILLGHLLPDGHELEV